MMAEKADGLFGENISILNFFPKISAEKWYQRLAVALIKKLPKLPNYTSIFKI